MILRNGDVKSFIDRIYKEDKRIILFGAGVIMQTIFPYLSSAHDLTEKVECIIDNDELKIGKFVLLNRRQILVNSCQYLKKIEIGSMVLLICASHYGEILEQLEKMELGNIECYILPMMYVTNLNMSNRGVMAVSETPLIPKKIHYMWFGKKAMPESLQRCVDSWEKFCPDYEIIRWDESNYDVGKHPYMKQAYEHKQWGYIPDYGRIDVLYNYGGIYFDTDVEVIRNLDELLFQEAFTGIEKWNVINIGGGTGCVKHSVALKRILDNRQDTMFVNKDGTFNRMASGYYDTLPFIREGFRLDGSNQSVGGMNIYGYDYFHPYDYMSGQLMLTNNTFSIHHFNGGWLDEQTIRKRQENQSQFEDLLLKIE